MTIQKGIMWIRLLKNNLIYAIGSVANSAAVFLLIPFIINAFSQIEYGLWSIYEILILFLIILISAGMDIGLMREYWFLEDDQERSILSGTVILAVLIWGIVLFFILFIGFEIIRVFPFFYRFNLDEFPKDSLLLVFFIGYIETLFSVMLAILRIKEQPIYFVIFSVARMIMFLGFGILGIKATGDINGALSGRLLASLIGFIGAALFIFPGIKLKIAWKHLKRVLNYGLPLIPANLSSYILISSDRYILNATSTLSIVAIYSFVYKLSSLLDVVVNRPFATDWAARRFKFATQDNAPKKFSDVLTIYFYLSSLAVLVIYACSHLIYKLIAPLPYIDGLKVLPILLFALQIYGLSYPLNVGLVIKDKTSTVAKIGIFSAIFCISVELWLIPKFGMIGAAWSTFLSYAVWTTAITVFSLKIYPIHYDLRKISLIGLATTIGYIGLYVISQFLPDVTIIGSLLINLLWLAGVYGITGFILIKKNPQ